MIITDEKRVVLKKVYALVKNNRKFGDIMKECNISRTELETVRRGIYYKIKMDVLISRMSQIQEGMTDDEISIIIRGVR